MRDGDGDLDPLLAQPLGVDPSRAGLDRFEEPGVQTAFRVAGQVHRDGDRLLGRGHLRWSPDVFVDLDRPHATDPSRGLDQRLGVWLDRSPAGVPSDARWRASAEPVVSSWRSPSTAHPIARRVSLARGDANPWPRSVAAG